MLGMALMVHLECLDVIFSGLLFSLMENSTVYATISLVRQKTKIRYFQWFVLRFIDKIEEIMKCLMHVIPNLTSS